MEHQKFQCIGSFSCPGEMKMNRKPPPELAQKMKDRPKPSMETWWHGDIKGRPDKRDLLKAELFIEDKLEEILVRHKGQHPG